MIQFIRFILALILFFVFPSRFETVAFPDPEEPSLKAKSPSDGWLWSKESFAGEAPKFIDEGALLREVKSGNPDRVQALLNNGAKLSERDDNGDTALHMAIENVEMMKILLNAGAMPDASNYYGTTPLMWAANFGKTEAIKILLSAGANVNWKNHSGITPLMDAIRRGHIEAAKLLLEGKAEVNDTTFTGITALMLAVAIGNSEEIKLLLAAGADVNAKSMTDSTALSIAIAEKNDEIVELLKRAGASN